MSDIPTLKEILVLSSTGRRINWTATWRKIYDWAGQRWPDLPQIDRYVNAHRIFLYWRRQVRRFSSASIVKHFKVNREYETKHPELY